MQARPELNGFEGVVSFYDEAKDRWQVELQEVGAKLLKAGNLEQQQEEIEAARRVQAVAEVEETVVAAGVKTVEQQASEDVDGV